MLERDRRVPVTWAALPAASSLPPESVRRWAGPVIRAGVLGTVALLAALRGAWVLVGIASVSAVVLTTLSAVSPRAARAIDGAAAKMGHGAILVVSAVGVAVIEIFVVIPGRVIAVFRRRSALNGVGPHPGSTWRARSAPSGRAQADRPWMRDVPGHRRGGGRSGLRVLRVVPYVVVLLVLDLVAGSLVAGRVRPSWVQPSQEVLGAAEPGIPGVPDGSYADQLGASARPRQPAAKTCLSEADGLRYDYVQFLVRQVRDTSGSCITVRGGMRTSFEPAGTDLPEVWVLGGSAAFGVGQRDGHTIASELARQSEEAGSAVRVRNFAVPGFTAYQEALLLEQLLAVRDAPELVILYDGMNDVGAQIAAPYGEATLLPARVWRSDVPANERTLWQRWMDRSFVARLAQSYFDQTAGAEPGSPVDAAGDAEVAAGTVAVLGRSIDLASRVGALHHVPVVSVFQATDPDRRGAIVDRVVDELPDGMLDGSRAIPADAADAVFFDSVHVDEDGAVLVAAWLREQLPRTVLGGGGS